MVKIKKPSGIKEVPDAKKKVFVYVVSVLTFFFGLSLLIGEIEIYRKTIIDWKVPLFICITIGALSNLVFYNTLVKHGDMKSILVQLPFNIVGVGGIAVYVFMWFNFEFSEVDVTHKKVKVLEVKELLGPKNYRDKVRPVLVVKYEKSEKELIFRYNQRAIVEIQDSVELVFSKGAFDYNVIKQVKFMKFPKSGL